VAAHRLSVSVVMSGMVVNQEYVRALLKSTETTDPIVIPELAAWLEDTYERIVPHANWAVQHG